MLLVRCRIKSWRVPGHRASNWERPTAVSVAPETRFIWTSCSMCVMCAWNDLRQLDIWLWLVINTVQFAKLRTSFRWTRTDWLIRTSSSNWFQTNVARPSRRRERSAPRWIPSGIRHSPCEFTHEFFLRLCVQWSIVGYSKHLVVNGK